MGDLVERLREHAYRVGPNDSNYDPETLDLETAAADRIEDLEAENNRLRAIVRGLAGDLQAHIDERYARARDYPDMKRKYQRDMRIVREARAALEGDTQA